MDKINLQEFNPNYQESGSDYLSTGSTSFVDKPTSGEAEVNPYSTYGSRSGYKQRDYGYTGLKQSTRNNDKNQEMGKTYGNMEDNKHRRKPKDDENPDDHGYLHFINYSDRHRDNHGNYRYDGDLYDTNHPRGKLAAIYDDRYKGIDYDQQQNKRDVGGYDTGIKDNNRESDTYNYYSGDNYVDFQKSNDSLNHREERVKPQLQGYTDYITTSDSRIHNSGNLYEDLPDYEIPPDYPGANEVQRSSVILPEFHENMESGTDDNGQYEFPEINIHPPRRPLPNPEGKRHSLCSGQRLLIVLLIAIVVIALVLLTCGIVYLVLDDNKEEDVVVCWSDWNNWSDCGQSCGESMRSRSRICDCDPDKCLGRDSETEVCYVDICPGPEYGKWTPWSSWDQCTKSCDEGIQTRSRVCETEPGDLHCQGKPQQDRACNQFDCPDCNRTCPDGGVVDQECTRCLCSPGVTLKGHVKNSNNVFLTYVTVSDSVWPSEVLTHTDDSGDFTLDSACVGVVLRLDKANYVTIYENITGPTETFVMQEIELLWIITHPEDKLRVLDEAVRLCCTVGGSPPPNYFEWLKDNQAIEDQSNNELILQSVGLEDQGNYQCKAVNDYSTVTSYPASLSVKAESSEYCSTSLQSRIITIDDCHGGEPLQLDVGMCDTKPCHMGTADSEQCGDQGGLCCGPKGIHSSQITCDHYNIPVYYVNECSCMECPPEGVVLRGAVVDFESGNPVFAAVIFIDDIASSSTDINGTFVITIDDVGYKNIFIRVTHQKYVDVIREELITESGSVQAIFLAMFQRADSLRIDSSDDTIIPLMELTNNRKKIVDTYNSYGNISIPADSFLNMSGESYKGDVNASLTTIDVTDITAMLNSPGEMNYVNTEGQRQPLRAFTIFSMSFIDSVYGEKLQLKNNVSISLLLPYSPPEDPMMFTLNGNSGLWNIITHLENEETDDTTVKGNFSLSLEYQWLSISSPISTSEICYSKLHIFETDAFTKKLKDSVNIKIVVNDQSYSSDILNYGEIAVNRAYSDGSLNENGYCIAHSCTRDPSSVSSYHGTLFVEYTSNSESPYLRPAIDNNGISEDTAKAIQYEATEIDNIPAAKATMSFGNIPQDNIGPFYDQSTYNWKSSPTCSSLSKDHFRFFVEESTDDEEKCTQSSSYTVQETILIPHPTAPEYNYLAWFARSDRSLYDTCYMKVLVTSPEDVSFRAFSKVGNLTFGEDIIPGKTVYGFRDKCKSTTMCLEVKHSGKVYGGNIDSTLIDIYQFNKQDVRCKVKAIKEELLIAYSENIISQDERFQMYLDDTPYGPTFGIYCAKAESSLNTVQQKTKGQCYRGDYDDVLTSPIKENDLNWAVHFECESTLSYFSFKHVN